MVISKQIYDQAPAEYSNKMLYLAEISCAGYAFTVLWIASRFYLAPLSSWNIPFPLACNWCTCICFHLARLCLSASLLLPFPQGTWRSKAFLLLLSVDQMTS